MRTLLAATLVLLAAPVPGPGSAAPPVSSVDVVHRWPHDPGAFTEGLLFEDGSFLESAGGYGSSSLRRVDPPTGRVSARVDLDRQYAAEGIAVLNGTVYQLTWHEQRVFRYDAGSLAAEGSLPFDGEAWGLTDDGERLILSDGTNVLRFLDPDTLAVTRRVDVLDRGVAVTGLNELEYVDGEIYANQFGARRIARIDPTTGALLGWIDLADLVASVSVSDEDAVLNGIAYDRATRRLFVTGKRWPDLFEIRTR